MALIGHNPQPPAVRLASLTAEINECARAASAELTVLRAQAAERQAARQAAAQAEELQEAETRRASGGGLVIRTSRDAELAACLWMREHGFTDATCTGQGADGGVDVESSEAVAQVKAQVKPVGRPVVQQITGIAAVERKFALVFALGGYTPDARQWADKARVALFTLALEGNPVAVNPSGQMLDDRR